LKPVDVQKGELRSGPPRRGFWARALRNAVRTILPLVILAGGYAGYKALEAMKPEVAKRPPQERVWAVQTMPVAFAANRPDLILYGETIPGRKLDLRALVTGEVVRVGEKFLEGAAVDRGDLLFEIDPFNYQGAVDEAAANLLEARARLQEVEERIRLEREALQRANEQLDLAKRDLARARELQSRGNLSEKGVDDRALVVSQREQAVEQRQSNLRIERARADQQRAVITRLEWRLRKARRDLENTKVYAPFDAYVSDVRVEVGHTVTANDVGASLLDRNWLEVKITLSNEQYGRLAEGDNDLSGHPVKVIWRAGSNVIEYPGIVERIAAEIDSSSGGVDIYARVQLPESPALIRAGAFVEIVAEDVEYANTVRLPETAIYNAQVVYVVVDGRLEERIIELVGHDGEDILVTGALEDGERVVVTRISEIGSGLKVEETPL